MSESSLRSLIEEAALRFEGHFARKPTLGALAPGRVNLIGDHTDYSGGLCMPCAINLYTIAVAAPASGSGEIHIVSTHAPESSVTLSAAVEQEPRGDWADYLRGVRAGFSQRGIDMPALDILIAGDLPLGAGLSSSASLELCFAALIEAASGATLEPDEKALLCQQAEHDFAGVPCGILDQFAIAHARAGTAMILDCRSQSITHTDLPPGFEVIVIDSGVRHALNDGGYADRRRAVEDALRILHKSLRDATPEDLEKLEDPTLRACARHVVSENQRVIAFAGALKNLEWKAAGEIMVASHRSLAEDFAVSCPEIDWLVTAVLDAGAYGARMTGGGFGGSVVCLAPADALDRIDTLVSHDYAKACNRQGELRRLQPASAATAIPVTSS